MGVVSYLVLFAASSSMTECSPILPVLFSIELPLPETTIFWTELAFTEVGFLEDMAMWTLFAFSEVGFSEDTPIWTELALPAEYVNILVNIYITPTEYVRQAIASKSRCTNLRYQSNLVRRCKLCTFIGHLILCWTFWSWSFVGNIESIRWSGLNNKTLLLRVHGNSLASRVGRDNTGQKLFHTHHQVLN